LTLTAGTFTEIVLLDPDRPHTRPDERGCPDCGDDSYDSGCTAQRIETAYRQLCRLDPAADGVPGNQITAARRKAARLGWYGP
ncbi:hypothetical protein KBZ21_40245, partial [Streptomyces sp. A73]|nr:hypothetical protein [Streptomyces sp. A73]